MGRMTRRRAREVRSTLAIWGLTWLVAVAFQGNRTPPNVVANGIFCLAVTLVAAAIYRRFLPRLRALPLLPAVLIAGLAMLLGVALALFLVVALILSAAYGGPFRPEVGARLARVFGAGGGWRGIVYAFLTVVGVTLTIELVRRLGPQRLTSLVLGRYRDPREERRVFLLIDLRDSTPLAERLGSVRFSALLRDLFRDLTEPIVDTGGEVVGYVGDEAIVCWPERRGLEEANALRCFRDVRARVRDKAPVYEARYGVAPRLKAAIHLGPIVITEVGELRTDVAFHGDALNTASRILDACGDHDAEALLSASTAEGLPALPGVELEPLGPFPLRGKGEPVGLVRARFL